MRSQTALLALSVTSAVIVGLFMAGVTYAGQSTTIPGTLLFASPTSAPVPFMLAKGGGGPGSGGNPGKGSGGMSGGKAFQGNMSGHHRHHGHYYKGWSYADDPCWSCRWNGYQKICYNICDDDFY